MSINFKYNGKSFPIKASAHPTAMRIVAKLATKPTKVISAKRAQAMVVHSND